MRGIVGWDAPDRALDLLVIVVPGVALLAGAAWAVARGLPRQPATRHLVLLSALIGSALLPALATAGRVTGWTLVAIPILPPLAGSTAGASLDRPASTVEPRPALPLARPGADHGSPGPAPSIAGRRPDRAPGRPAAAERPGREARWPAPLRAVVAPVLLAWGVGTLALLLGFVRSCRAAGRLRRAGVPITAEPWRRVATLVAGDIGWAGPPAIVATPAARTPFVAGFGRPAVVLPTRLLDLADEPTIRDILAHEFAHIRRGDLRVVLLAELVRAAYWPIAPIHPLIRELGRAREDLCDNHVLRRRDAVAYGATLLHLAEFALGAPEVRAVVGIFPGRGDLERRIAGLLDARRSRRTASSRWVTGVVASLVLIGGTIVATTRLVAGPPPVAPRVPAAQVPEAAGRSILIRVVGPDGVPVRGVQLHRSVWSSKLTGKANDDAMSDDRGEARFSIPAELEIVRFWVRAGGFVPLFAHWERPDDPERNLPAEYTFHLERGTTIGGVVQDEAGRPVEGARVEVDLQGGGKVDGPVSPDGHLASGDVPVTDAQGRWSLDNVPAGDDLKILLKFAHPDYIADAEWRTAAEDQALGLPALRARTTIVKLRPGIILTGRVTDPAGKPVPRAVVVRGDQPYMEADSQEVRTDDRGVYRFPPLQPGALNLTVIAEGWMPTLRPVTIAPGMAPVDWSLEPGRDLRIRFVDPAGRPIPRVFVMIDGWRGGMSLYNNRHPNVLDTAIPIQADADGRYRWSWAPADAVRYRAGNIGLAEAKVDLIADGSEHRVTIQGVRQVAGRITAAATGRPIELATATPVLETGFPHGTVDRQQSQRATGGSYAIDLDRLGVVRRIRVRVEAEGYRSAMSPALDVAAANPPVDFRLDPAPPVRGRVVDGRGLPVPRARVHLATVTQPVVIRPDDNFAVTDNLRALTDDGGEFTLPAQFEPYTLVAIDDGGHAMGSYRADQQPGDLTLRDWARVEGRLIRSGRPVAGASIHLQPTRVPDAASPPIHDSQTTQTDRDGRFTFAKALPAPALVQVVRTPGFESDPRSSPPVPLDLRPGELVKVELGEAIRPTSP